MVEEKKATKHKILYLVGLLQHATKVVRPGRSFVSRMYSTVAKVKDLDFYAKLNKEFWSDLIWWRTFVNSWKGLSLLMSVSQLSQADFLIQTDASGTGGVVHSVIGLGYNCSGHQTGYQFLSWQKNSSLSSSAA